MPPSSTLLQPSGEPPVSFLARSGIIQMENTAMSSREHEALVNFLHRRSRRRFTRLVRLTREIVLNAAYRVTADEHIAEDVTQDVFVKLLTAKWDPDRIRCGRALLVSTTVLTAMMRIRGEERLRRREERAAEQRAVGARSLTTEDVLAIRDAVLELPEALKACVDLRYYGGLSSREIADSLGCSHSSVKQRLAKAREILRDRLGALGIAVPFLDGADGASSAIQLSPRLRTALSALCRNGPHAALVATGASGAGSLKSIVAVAALLLISGLGLWQFDRSWIGEEVAHETRAFVNSAPPPPIDAGPEGIDGTTRDNAVSKARIRPNPVGSSPPPERVIVRASADGISESRVSLDCEPVEIPLPPGTCVIEIDGRPRWSTEVLELEIGMDTSEPSETTVDLQDWYTLDGAVTDLDGESVKGCTVVLIDPAGSELHPRSQRLPGPSEFRATLQFGTRYELVILDPQYRFRRYRDWIENTQGSTFLEKQCTLEPVGAPLNGILVGCDGAPPERARIAVRGMDRFSSYHVLVSDTNDDGSFVLRDFPRNSPFALQIQCAGYVPRQVPIDPKTLPETVVIELECSEVFYGRVVPPQPRRRFWSIWVDGPDRHPQIVLPDERGRFAVRGSDLDRYSMHVEGPGFESTDVDTSAETSRDRPAVIGPVRLDNAKVEVVVEDSLPFSSVATVSLQPSRGQGLRRLVNSHLQPLRGGRVTFDRVFPARYDVGVEDLDGNVLTWESGTLVRGPLTRLNLKLKPTGVVLELRNTRLVGGSDLVLSAGAAEPLSLECVDGFVELPLRPDWHLVRLSRQPDELLFHGRVLLSSDVPFRLDFSQLATLEIVRNSDAAPTALVATSSPISDGSRTTKIVFPLQRDSPSTVVRWLATSQTVLSSLRSEFGCYLLNQNADARYQIPLGHLETLQIPITRGDPEGRAFLLGKLPGGSVVYWHPSQWPAAAGELYSVPVESSLSSWALIRYRGALVRHTIVDGVERPRAEYTVEVRNHTDAPIADAKVSIRGRELLGLRLEDFFHWDSVESFFTLGEGRTDESGRTTFNAPVYDRVEIEASLGKYSSRRELPDRQRSIVIALDTRE